MSPQERAERNNDEAVERALSTWDAPDEDEPPQPDIDAQTKDSKLEL